MIPAPPEITSQRPEPLLRRSDEAIERAGFTHHRGHLGRGLSQHAHLVLAKRPRLHRLHHQIHEGFSRLAVLLREIRDFLEGENAAGIQLARGLRHLLGLSWLDFNSRLPERRPGVPFRERSGPWSAIQSWNNVALTRQDD